MIRQHNTLGSIPSQWPKYKDLMKDPDFFLCQWRHWVVMVGLDVQDHVVALCRLLQAPWGSLTLPTNWHGQSQVSLPLESFLFQQMAKYQLKMTPSLVSNSI